MKNSQWHNFAHDGLLPDFIDKSSETLPDININNLYDIKSAHPIIEYLPSKEDSEAATLTPSFVLEVTWPRVVQFYHPASPRCQSLQATYISLARGIKRRSSRLPVEFHAVNCGIYREVCQQRFNIKAVPTIIGLRSGSIDGSELSLPGSTDSSGLTKKKNEQDIVLKVEYLAQTMGIPLDAVKGGQEGNTFAKPALDLFEVNNYGEDSSLPESIPLSEQVFHDAQSSLLATLSSSLYSQLPPGKSLPPATISSLSDFLDLIRWAHPPETKMHDLAEDLKMDFASISMSEEGLLKAIRRHADPEHVTWSPRCGTNGKGGYACGLWSLLHILSIGVAERHSSVVGYAESVTVIHAGEVIRSFIDKFFIGCDTCKISWLELYDEAAQSAEPLTGDKDEWRNLSIWIWIVHNQVTGRRDQSSGKGYYREQARMVSSSSLWPSKQDCPKCWQSLTDDTGLVMSMDSYDKKQVFYQLKKIYWPGGVHNNRLIVLERWSKAKRALSMNRVRARMAANWTFSSLLFYFLSVCLVLRIVFPRRCIRITNRLCLFIMYRNRRFFQGGNYKRRIHVDRSNKIRNGNNTRTSAKQYDWEAKSHSSNHPRQSRYNSERYGSTHHRSGGRRQNGSSNSEYSYNKLFDI